MTESDDRLEYADQPKPDDRTDENVPPDQDDRPEQDDRVAAVTGEAGDSVARKRRRTVIIAAVVLLAVAALSWWAGRATTTTSGLAQRGKAPTAPVLTAPVVRKKLGLTLQATGKVVAAGSETVAIGSVSAPGAESIVTAGVLHVGQTVGNGTVVAQVAGRPVFAFGGSTPMYRTLMSGESGADIAQLQHDLGSLGYGITDTAGSYAASTSAALAQLYQHAGYAPPPSQPSGRRQGNRLIVEPPGEIVFVPRLPAIVAGTKEPIGKAVGSPAVTLTYGSVVVDETLTPAQGYLTEPGDRATVTVGPIRPLTGVVRSVKRSVSKPTASATIALSGAAAGAHIGSHVGVSIDAQSSAVQTTAVPIGALYADGAGSAYVIVAGPRRQHIAVTVGQAVGGYVPIIDPPVPLLPGTKLVLDASQASSNGGLGGA